MGIGTAVRHRLGRWEVPAAELYRSAFINLDDLATALASLGPVKRILEIGCGEGAMADRLCRVYPGARYVGIDISGQPGRMFQGDVSRATFRTMSSTELLAERPASFDLVTIVDVVHHIADDLRPQVLRDAAELTGPEGLLAVKEWEQGRGLSHFIAYTADRYVSGDADVRFMPSAELRDLIATTLPEFRLVCESRIPPRRNNLLLALRRHTD